MAVVATDELQGDQAGQPAIASQIDAAHAAAPEHAQEFVAVPVTHGIGVDDAVLRADAGKLATGQRAVEGRPGPFIVQAAVQRGCQGRLWSAIRAVCPIVPGAVRRRPAQRRAIGVGGGLRVV